MKRPYWDQLAETFESDVLQIVEADTHGVFQSVLEKFADSNAIAYDFGCGTGSATRLVAPYFKSTVGIDFSAPLIEKASQKTGKDVSYLVGDISKPLNLEPKPDIALLINVLIQENAILRETILGNIVENLAPTGTLIIAVPSLESTLHVYRALLNSELASGNSASRARSKIDRLANSEIISITEGIVSVGGEPTKLYTLQALQVLAQTHSLQHLVVQKIFYPWAEKVDSPDVLNQVPEPWDWLITASKADRD